MSDNHPSAILVDDRERASGLLEALRHLLGERVRSARLAVGDVRIGEALIVERKEAADFVASLLDGRLERQAHAMAATGRQTVIVIEGDFTGQTLAGMSGAEVRAAMLALALDWRLPVLRARDVQDTAQWIAALARHQAGERRWLPLGLRPAATSRPHPAGHRAARLNPSQILNPHSAIRIPQSVPLAALRRVPGLGPARAKALLEHFGTMQAMLAAGDTELAAVPGIGPALARAIRKELGP